MSRALLVCILVCSHGCSHDPAHPVDGHGATADATLDDGGTPVADLSYIALQPGWKVEVFRDLTVLHPYVDMQFDDTDEIYDNGISRPFLLSGMQGDQLGICAGRQILLVTRTTFAVHDYGNHAPDTAQFPDQISSAIWKQNSIVLSSSSRNDGDGLFTVTPDWSIARTLVDNNTREVILDDDGSFDAVGTPGLYYGDITGVYRLLGAKLIVGSADASSLAIRDGTLLFVDRASDTMATLYSIASSAGAHTKVHVLDSMSIELGKGPAFTPNSLGWAILDGTTLTELPSGTVATSSDAGYAWTGMVVPPVASAFEPNFPSIYVTEDNRTRNIERILRFTRL